MSTKNREEREKRMIELFQIISPEEVIDRETKIRGTSIAKLCEYEAGGYNRVMTWLEKAVESYVPPSQEEEILPEEKAEEKTDEKDEIELFYEKCLSLYRERKGKYGDSWKVLTPESTANLIEMKANRAWKMGRENAKSLDEALDMSNYAAMLYVKLNNLK